MYYFPRIINAVVLVIFLLFNCLSLYSQKTETRSVEGLIYELKHPDAETRKNAAILLGKNQIRSAVPDLISVTKDPDSSVRLEAAKALVAINDTRALDAFISLTRDPEVAIRSVAVEGIVKIYVADEKGFVDGVKQVVNFLNPLSDSFNPLTVEPYIQVSENAVTALADLLFDNNKGLRKSAAEALGILRGKSVLPAIMDALAKEQDNDIKITLIQTIYKIGEPSAGEALIPLIRDPDTKVHEEAIVAVGRLKVTEAVPQLNELYSAGIEQRRKIFGIVPVSGTDYFQRKVLEALAQIGDPRSSNIFEDALNDERDHYRRYGAEGLGRIGKSDYQSLIARHYLREKSENAKLAMGYSLFLLGREEHIVELVDNISKDQVYYYLLELPPSKVAMLHSYVQTEGTSTKIRLLSVMGLAGDTSGMPIIQEMTQDENADIASAANLAVRRLQGRFPNG